MGYSFGHSKPFFLPSSPPLICVASIAAASISAAASIVAAQGISDFKWALVARPRPRNDDAQGNREKPPDYSTTDMMDMDSLGSSVDLSSQFASYLEEKQSSAKKTKFNRYKEANCVKECASFDVLYWWSKNSNDYPILARMARDILAFPVSTVASESTFSTGGRILSPYRSSLNPQMVEALVCCQNWLRSDHATLDVQESMKEVCADENGKYAEMLREFRESESR
ncbi:hypothetical protein OROGR_031312 [Orobanche gracilis]